MIFRVFDWCLDLIGSLKMKSVTWRIRWSLQGQDDDRTARGESQLDLDPDTGHFTIVLPFRILTNSPTRVVIELCNPTS